MITVLCTVCVLIALAYARPPIAWLALSLMLWVAAGGVVWWSAQPPALPHVWMAGR